MPQKKRNSKPINLSFSTNRQGHVEIPFLDKIIFLLFVILFYAFVLLYIKPVDGINDDWGMYSTLSGAYLGYPDAHVLFFLYPLSWFLSRLYMINSSIPWFSLFQHSIHIICIYFIYHRTLQIWKKHTDSSSVIFPALTTLFTLFFLVDFNVICEAQYTTTAGFAAATALFCFTTAKSDDTLVTFLKGNIPTFLLAWLAFSMRQNILYLMLPMAGMLWLAKWLLSNHRFYKEYIIRFFLFAGILLLGMGILFGVHNIAYSAPEWSDFVKINHYRERVGDFYTWPEYEECSSKLAELGIDEEKYNYMRNGAPYIGYDMTLEDWENMNQIAKECYEERISVKSRLKNVLVGSISVFFYQDGMQPLNLLVAVLLVLTPLLILYRRNFIALAVYFFYLFGRMVSWGYVLFEGRFPKRIIQPLMFADFLILLAILLAFNLLKWKSLKPYTVILPCIALLSVVSVYSTKTDIDTAYHANQTNWEGLKEYCRSNPDNFYIWTYNSNTLDTYCEYPFDMKQDTYNNFFYTNWGVVCNPNSKIKLAKHGIENFGQDLVESDNVYFIFEEGLYYDEHPVIMYFRHTYDVGCELTDTFSTGDSTYEVYQLR
ncbi:MAG: hypothetical protein J6B68_05480 [Lachnospiraceae bacterium]|nr:hypothetical protein [Lachnospiraceae bacterium]